MTCPYCKSKGYDRVMQTFQVPEGIRRRRKCQKCGKLFYSLETVAQISAFCDSKTVREVAR